MDEQLTKKPWQSKTNWVALILAVAAFFPQFQSLVRGNPEAFTFVVGLVFGVLRLVTKHRISIE